MKIPYCIAGLAVLCQLGLVSGAPIPGLFNTGVNASNELLGPDGEIDPHYTLTSGDDPSFPGPNALTISQIWPVAPHGPWLADGPLSRWISPTPTTSVAQGNYIYTTTFNLTGFEYETARIDVKWASDDGGQIVLNGTVVATGGGFGGFANVSITHDPDNFIEFLPGENTLEFLISNGSDGPSGLRVEMIGFVEVANEPPSIRVQPPAVISGFEATPLEAEVVVDGSAPFTFQWKRNGQDVPGQTTNTLFLLGETEESGEYTLVVTNTSGTVTTNPVRVYVVEPLPGIYPTGVDDQGNFLEDGDIDSHYVLVENPDTEVPEATVLDTQEFPIVDGPWVNTQESSKWIGPQANTNSSAGGDYRYRLTFDLTGYDPASVLIDMMVTSDNFLALHVNGVATGVSGPGAFDQFTPLSLRSGIQASFLPGVNTLDFVVNNAGAGPTGLNVASLVIGAAKGAATALPPSILRQPAPNRVMQGANFTLDVLADGAAPLAYQWRKDGQALEGKTGSSLTVTGAQVADGGAYSVVITNSVGEVTSEAAAVIVLPPIAGLLRNTGLDNAGELLEDEAEDSRYELVSAPDGVPTGPAVAISGAPIPPWYAVEDGSARWIGVGPDSMAVPGYYVYQLKFDLTGYDPATALIEAMWATDDLGSLRLNGTPVGGAAGGFTTPAPLVIARNFVAGVNTLEFIVENGGEAENPSGLLVYDLRIGAVATPAPPPPPVAQLEPQPDGRIKVSYTPVPGWKPYISATLLTGSWTDATALFSADGDVVSITANPAELRESYLRFHYEP